MVAILENGCHLCPGKDCSGPIVKNYGIMGPIEGIFCKNCFSVKGSSSHEDCFLAKTWLLQQGARQHVVIVQLWAQQNLPGGNCSYCGSYTPSQRLHYFMAPTSTCVFLLNKTKWLHTLSNFLARNKHKVNRSWSQHVLGWKFLEPVGLRTCMSCLCVHATNMQKLPECTSVRILPALP